MDGRHSVMFISHGIHKLAEKSYQEVLCTLVVAESYVLEFISTASSNLTWSPVAYDLFV